LEGLIISGTGLLGSRLAALSDYDFTYRSGDPGPDRERAHRLDLRDLAALRSLLIEGRPRVVILSAAMTDVDACEEEREGALRVNYEAPAVVAEAVRSYGGYLVFISTDYVFDGLKGELSGGGPHEPGELLWEDEGDGGEARGGLGRQACDREDVRPLRRGIPEEGLRPLGLREARGEGS
jgi:dTDP-4-dehydrorhamnose reductase